MKSFDTKQLLGEQLVCCRDIEGRPNVEYVAFLRELNEWFLLNDQNYIGLAPYGSQARGYATKKSDFDVMIICGPTTCTAQAKIEKNINKIAKKYGKKGNSPHISDEEHFTLNFECPPEQPSACYYHAAWLLLHPFIGKVDKINSFRQMARNLHHFNLENLLFNAERNIRDTLETVIFWEFGVHLGREKSITEQLGRDAPINESSQKMLARGFSIEDLTDIIEKRTRLWQKRVARLYDVPSFDAVPTPA